MFIFICRINPKDRYTITRITNWIFSPSKPRLDWMRLPAILVALAFTSRDIIRPSALGSVRSMPWRASCVVGREARSVAYHKEVAWCILYATISCVHPRRAYNIIWWGLELCATELGNCSSSWRGTLVSGKVLGRSIGSANGWEQGDAEDWGMFESFCGLDGDGLLSSGPSIIGSWAGRLSPAPGHKVPRFSPAGTYQYNRHKRTWSKKITYLDRQRQQCSHTLAYPQEAG